jgi:hypothetical protein
MSGTVQSGYRKAFDESESSLSLKRVLWRRKGVEGMS